MTIDDIRQTYPNPIAGRQAQYPYSRKEYCCGGAYCMYVGITDPEMMFPMQRELAAVLKEQNETLDWEGAHEFARSIIDYNDASLFEEAWQLLAQALPVITTKED